MIPASILGHARPWTESDYLALGETTQRVELLDGSLLIGPSASVRHQVIVARLAAALEPGCAAANCTLLPVINLRLNSTRIFKPDFVVTAELDFTADCVPADRVMLVGEVRRTTHRHHRPGAEAAPVRHSRYRVVSPR